MLHWNCWSFCGDEHRCERGRSSCAQVPTYPVAGHVNRQLGRRDESLRTHRTFVLLVVQVIHTQMVTPRSVHVEDAATVFALIFGLFAVGRMLVGHVMAETHFELEPAVAFSAFKLLVGVVGVASHISVVAGQLVVLHVSGHG
jgi:RsiW-degrading membrane proteinase PrsW (M82 family)